MAACVLTLKSTVGQPVIDGPDNPSKKVTYLLAPSASYGGPGVGDTIDVSAQLKTQVSSARIACRRAITDVDLIYVVQLPADLSPTGLVLRIIDGSTGAEVAATTNLSAQTVVLEAEGY